jgi:uncharacterized protein
MHKLMIVAAFVLAGHAVRAQDLAGDWTGTLDTGNARLNLVLHIAKAADGALTATLDSVDQNALGIPVKSVQVEGGKLSLDIAAVHGTYVGTSSADGKSIVGTWTQRAPLPLTFARASTSSATKPVTPSDIDGAWSGTIDAGAMKLRVVFHITNTANGLKATLDSIDQGANGIPVASVTRKEASIRFDVAAAHGTFDAKISADGERIEGTWSQGGNAIPLVLRRVKNAAELERRRPQEPKAPLPYGTRDVHYDNKESGFTLAATLTIPQGPGPFPAVLLISGSGKHDRDEALLGHKPFLILADQLTRRGIVVLRADKRGVGQSGGNYATATTMDFASDAVAGLAYLKTVPLVDAHRIGLLGHSEGGVIAPIVAAAHPADVAFIVLLAGSGVPGDQIIVAQTRLIAAANGASADQAKAAAEQERELLDVVKKAGSDSDIEAELRTMLKGKVPDSQIDSALAQVMSPWFRTFISFDPATALRKVKCPTLAIGGSKDLQVPAHENLAAIKSALEAGGNKSVETVEYPGLNHLFQHAKSGSPGEYAEIEETMSPEVTEKVGSWILQRR